MALKGLDQVPALFYGTATIRSETVVGARRCQMKIRRRVVGFGPGIRDICARRTQGGKLVIAAIHDLTLVRLESWP